MTTMYTTDHEWINIEDHEAAVVGITLLAQDALGDVVFVDLPEVGRRLGPGQLFGEIAFFAPDGRRSSSARCASPCTVMSIDEHTFKQLIYQNPDFGLEMLRLIAGRLSQDVQRLQGEQSARRGAPERST